MSTPEIPPAVEVREARARAALDMVEARMVRAYAQTATLSTLSAGMTTAGIAVLALADLPWIAAVGGWAAMVLTGTALYSLLAAARPRLKGAYGVVAWAGNPEAVLDMLGDAPGPHVSGLACDVAAESAIVLAKFRANRRATLLMCAALGAVGGAAVWLAAETLMLRFDWF